MTSKRVFIVGAGTMGSGIAQVAATSGHDVTCMDVVPEALDKARAAIARSTKRLVEKGALTGEQQARAESVHFASDMSSAGAAEIAIEAATEDAGLKMKIFNELDGVAPQGAILATNTSSISITKLAAATKRADRVIGVHFMNPVPLMKLVEVVRGLATADDTATQVIEFCASLGKEPVEAQDSPGFISNRILCPMINEAVFTLQDNVGTAEAIDAVMRLGMNHPMGPLALADLIGLDVVLSVMEILQRDLGEDKYRPAPLLRRMVDAGFLGRKSGRGFYQY
jgi:3-hydroxybutyryl-CoA dehydrogenase